MLTLIQKAFTDLATLTDPTIRITHLQYATLFTIYLNCAVGLDSIKLCWAEAVPCELSPWVYMLKYNNAAHSFKIL